MTSGAPAGGDGARNESERRADEFLSLVAHELKTPLTPLKALAQLLRARMRRARTEGRELDLDVFDRNLATIERQVDRMTGLVNDLLEVTRSRQGRFALAFDTVDLASIVRDVVRRHSGAAEDEGRHRFDVDVPDALPVRGDAARLEQVVGHLVGNAVKFSPRGGDVSVTLARAGDRAELTVRDRGVGVSAEDLARIGQPFVRGSGKGGTFSGMGIGLYLAKLVAEGHGGEVELTSEGGDKGATVRMSLPISG